MYQRPNTCLLSNNSFSSQRIFYEILAMWYYLLKKSWRIILNDRLLHLPLSNKKTTKTLKPNKSCKKSSAEKSSISQSYLISEPSFHIASINIAPPLPKKRKKRAWEILQFITVAVSTDITVVQAAIISLGQKQPPPKWCSCFCPCCLW